MAGKSATAFRTISEVATELDLQQHVLRFWESKFRQIKPVKRAGGRRYYRPEDIQLLRRIRTLLHDDGYTIKGVQKLLSQKQNNSEKSDIATPPKSSATAPEVPAEPSVASAQNQERDAALRDILEELISVRGELRSGVS